MNVSSNHNHNGHHRKSKNKKQSTSLTHENNPDVSKSKTANPELSQKALSSASSLVLLQLSSRLLTFVFNQVLVRLATPRAFGTAAVQFELLSSTILFLCREGVRGALLRSNDTSKAKTKKDADFQTTLITNISHLPLLLGTPFAFLIATLYGRLASSQTVDQPFFKPAVALYTLAAVIELASEPLYIRAQNGLRVKVRVSAEGAGVICKAVFPVVVLSLAHLLQTGGQGAEHFALLAFAFGQLGYALAVLTVYISAYNVQAVLDGVRIKSVSSPNGRNSYFNKDLLRLSREMTGQSVVKHFLTEGDRFLVSYFSPPTDQGGYALASNYGSLVARIIFQPIEETARLFFSKTLANLSSSPEASQSSDRLQSSINTLLSLLLLMSHFTLLLITFLPPYLPLLTTLVLPSRYHATNAPSILMVYTYYLPTMAFNGVLEAFLFSAASPQELRAQSQWLFIFSAGFVLVAVGLARSLGMGDVGLVWANVVNLGMRAIYAVLFVERYLIRLGSETNGKAVSVRWRRALPPMGVIATFIISGVVARWSENKFASSIGGYAYPYAYALSGRKLIETAIPHVGIGLVSLGICMGICFVLERSVIREVIALIRRRDIEIF